MSWIKRANQYGKYYSSYRGFRIYLKAKTPGKIPIDQKLKIAMHGNFIALNMRGQIAEGVGIEGVAFEIDKICLLNY